jgi:hypothetical protein
VRVSAVYRRHAHHSRWSGYPRFVERLPEVRAVGPVRLPRRLLVPATRRIAHPWVGPDQLRIDLAAACRTALGRGEVVHLLYGESDLFLSGRLRLRGETRLVATFHQPPRLHDHLVPTQAVLDRLDHAIGLGPHAAAHLEARMGAGRVSHAFLGVDTEAWTPRPAARTSDPSCAFVGSWLRDFDVLAEVIRLVRAAEPRVRFEAVTTENVPAVRTRQGISDLELRNVYRRAWVGVQPLTDAVGNNALLEGMACGLPTVVSDVGDVADYTGPDGARLVPVGDPQAMAAAVLELLADRSAREELGRHARARAETRDLTAAARRHAEIYASLLP